MYLLVLYMSEGVFCGLGCFFLNNSYAVGAVNL